MQYQSSPECRSGDKEKIFNLQLAIQKLQEEVVLYRNGVDVPQLLELMREKDNEIDSLKESIGKLEDKNFLLLQSRAELISKQENLLDDIQQARLDKAAAGNKILILEEAITRKENEMKSMEDTIQHYEDNISEKHERVASLEANIRTLDNNVFELQNRCAKLVREKNDLTKTMDKEKTEKTKQITEYRNQIEKSMVYNNEIKEKLEQEHSKGLELAMKLKVTQKEYNGLSENGEHLHKELKNYMKICSDLQQENQSLQNQLNRVHDDKSRHYMNSDPSHGPSHGQVQISSGPIVASTNVISVSSSSHPVKGVSVQGINMDDAMKRIVELEGQIKKQDKYMKSKILRDKTNLMQQQLQYHDNTSFQHEPVLTHDFDDNVPKLWDIANGNHFEVKPHTIGEYDNMISPHVKSSQEFSSKDKVLSDNAKRRPFTRRRSGGSSTLTSPHVNFGVTSVDSP